MKTKKLITNALTYAASIMLIAGSVPEHSDSLLSHGSFSSKFIKEQKVSAYDISYAGSDINVYDLADENENNTYTEIEKGEKFTYDNCTYEVKNLSELEVSLTNGVTSKDSLVNIPETVVYKDKTLTVTSIEKYAFSHSSTLEGIIIPDSVKSIGELAFEYCKNLESIELPDSVESVGRGLFFNCANLKKVRLSNNIKTLLSASGHDEKGSRTCKWGFFEHCEKLESITIPDSVISIDDSAFRDCISLKEITIPDTVINVGGGLFYNCTNLKKVKLPDGMTSLNYSEYFAGSSSSSSYSSNFGFFEECTSLEEVVMPDSLIEIGECAFLSCSSLKEIVIPEGLESIGDTAFYNCKSITDIVIPDSVKKIGSGVFYGCSGLKNVVLSENITALPSFEDKHIFYTGGIMGFFDNCASLEKIIIPVNVASIEGYAFYGCTNLKSITILNPECYISDDAEMSGVIYGHKNSTAHSYAEKYKKEFIALDEESPATEPVTNPDTEETITTTAVQSEPAGTQTGDIDGDGEITLKDAVLIRRYIAGGWNIEINKNAADIDGDGEITLKDAVLIRRYIAGGWNVEINNYN